MSYPPPNQSAEQKKVQRSSTLSIAYDTLCGKKLPKISDEKHQAISICCGYTHSYKINKHKYFLTRVSVKAVNLSKNSAELCRSTTFRCPILWRLKQDEYRTGLTRYMVNNKPRSSINKCQQANTNNIAQVMNDINVLVTMSSY